MCYSAQVYAELRKFQRATGSKMDVDEYVKVYWIDRQKDPYRKRPKVPRATEIGILRDGPEEVASLIRQWDAEEMAELEQELFKQKRRVADAQRALQTKVTKKAETDVRVGSDKMERAQLRIEALKRKEPKAGDNRIFPGSIVPVMVVENGERVIKPMRYQCRIAGMPASSDFTKDRKPSGTYNARRDNLERFWRNQFGTSHGIIIADVFYENVEIDGQNERLAFVPRSGEPMYIACLWSHWKDPQGIEPDLLSFAAITDEPEAEVAAAGHDRTIINIKPEYLDAWLNPDGDTKAMQAILEDKQHPYYEHQIEKAA